MGLSGPRSNSRSQAYQWNREVPYDFERTNGSINEEARDLVDLEDVIETEHMHGLAEQTINATEDNVEQSIQPEEPTLPDLLID